MEEPPGDVNGTGSVLKRLRFGFPLTFPEALVAPAATPTYVSCSPSTPPFPWQEAP